MSKQNIIFFVGGLAAGAFITWIVEEARLRDLDNAWYETYDELLNDSMREEYDKKDETIGESMERSTSSDLSEKNTIHRKAADYHRYDHEYKDANDILAEHEHPMDDGEEPSDALEMTPEEIVEAVTDPNYKEGEEMYERKEAARVKGPTLITFESYTEDFPEFDKDPLYFYTINEVLATEDDEVVDNEYYVVGDCLDKFDFRHNHEDVIYIRNAGMSTDYEVHKVRGAFHPPEEAWG